jgi:hypothetical protein
MTLLCFIELSYLPVAVCLRERYRSPRARPDPAPDVDSEPFPFSNADKLTVRDETESALNCGIDFKLSN